MLLLLSSESQSKIKWNKNFSWSCIRYSVSFPATAPPSVSLFSKTLLKIIDTVSSPILLFSLEHSLSRLFFFWLSCSAKGPKWLQIAESSGLFSLLTWLDLSGHSVNCALCLILLDFFTQLQGHHGFWFPSHSQSPPPLSPHLSVLLWSTPRTSPWAFAVFHILALSDLAYSHGSKYHLCTDNSHFSISSGPLPSTPGLPVCSQGAVLVPKTLSR